MRENVAGLLLAIVVGGCAATAEQVVSTLDGRYKGKSVDTIVMKFGPPANRFEMDSGDVAYRWNLANQINAWRYGRYTFFCRVRAITGPDNVVKHISTEDASNIIGESLCAQTLNIKRQG
jgi:hypothetical protein